jgi:hypothetical protein
MVDDDPTHGLSKKGFYVLDVICRVRQILFKSAISFVEEIPRAHRFGSSLTLENRLSDRF